MSTEVAKQILLFIIAPSCGTTILTFLACVGMRDLLSRRRPGKRLGGWNDEWVWIGDLTGFRFEHPGRISLYHECGWVRTVPAGEHLSTVVADEALRHKDEGCSEYPLADATAVMPRHGNGKRYW